MMTEQILALSQNLQTLSPETKKEIERAFIDTFAVLCAGWDEPVTRALRKAHRGVCAPWDPANSVDVEVAALTWGTAAHALDYDDVHMTSVTHPSAVLIPAIEAAIRLEPKCTSRRAGAFALGLAVNVGLGSAMGFAHYAQGWHATSTIGAVAAGAAIAHLFNLDEGAFRGALAIAAAQSGGLQKNFGTMIKPLQAGLAAQAGVRAARLALAGIEGPRDAFGGSNGFLAVFGGSSDARPDFSIEAAATGISRKLFACCYMAHRPVAAAIQLHDAGAASILRDPEIRIDVEVPPGCLKALTVDIPSTGTEAKFSGHYTVAHALKTGRLGLSAFLPDNVSRLEVIDLARRVTLKESSSLANGEVGIDRGGVAVSLVRKGEVAASRTITHYPGSPASPMTDAELSAKLADCIAAAGSGESDLPRKIQSMATQFAGTS